MGNNYCDLSVSASESIIITECWFAVYLLLDVCQLSKRHELGDKHAHHYEQLNHKLIVHQLFSYELYPSRNPNLKNTNINVRMCDYYLGSR